jgi:TonB family protein
VAAVRGQLAAAVVLAAQAALDEAELASGEALRRAAEQLGADGEALAGLDGTIAAARALEAERRHTEWLGAAQRRIASGALTSPAGDSAVHYLTALQDEAPRFVGLDSTWERLVRELLDETAAAIDRQEWSRAAAAVAGLREAPNAASAASTAARRLETARLEREYRDTPAAASELELLSDVAPEYPKGALEDNVEGWVELEFLVDRTGVPKNLAAIAAEPAGRFEKAALEAVRQYRYRPFERDGHLFERRVRLRVRFTIE